MSILTKKVKHLPKYTQKFLLQMKREFPHPQGLSTYLRNCTSLLKRGHLSPDRFSQGSFSHSNFREDVWLIKAMARERLRAKCINWGVIWNVLTFKISFGCFIAAGQILLVLFSCTKCTANLTKWIDLFICL
uniref:Uncharacterized protein n=1 Tax=Molossus molossus TaxID=27622 RepID=A0A7J8GM05_MOLMO|nr:hypothetical protein HJG59_011475 [Molossus molossus]